MGTKAPKRKAVHKKPKTRAELFALSKRPKTKKPSLKAKAIPARAFKGIPLTKVNTSGPGMSNAGKYTKVKKDDFAGPKGTYPINTLARAKSALKLAHNAASPAAIRRKVYAKYPQLKKKK